MMSRYLSNGKTSIRQYSKFQKAILLLELVQTCILVPWRPKKSSLWGLSGEEKGRDGKSTPSCSYFPLGKVVTWPFKMPGMLWVEYQRPTLPATAFRDVSLIHSDQHALVLFYFWNNKTYLSNYLERLVSLHGPSGQPTPRLEYFVESLWSSVWLLLHGKNAHKPSERGFLTFSFLKKNYKQWTGL